LILRIPARSSRDFSADPRKNPTAKARIGGGIDLRAPVESLEADQPPDPTEPLGPLVVDAPINPGGSGR
jgi:hypothetical protein